MKAKRIVNLWNIGLFTVCFILTLTLSLTLVVCPGHTAIPQKINYQGYLTNASGVPINGTLEIIFAIYDVPIGGSPLWTETQTVSINHGVYSVNLGEVTPIGLAFNNPYYLGVRIGADPEMTPRKVLTSVGYAFRALTVESIGSHSHSGEDITSGIVAEARIDPLIARDSEVTAAVSAHASRTDNPHSTTAAQVGAAPIVHTHSGADITSGTVAEARIDPLIARDSEVTAAVNAHASRTDNPHSTTAAQVGAVALNQANSITSAMVVDGTITDADISGSAAISYSKLSGVASATHNHDGTYVKVMGDTMTGSLSLPVNGLVAGTNQLVLSGGNVGIGTANPTQRLEISGNVKISGTGNSLTFPDGTTQTTAVTGGGGGVPSGFMILGNTSTAPAGYTYTGKTIDASWSTKASMPTARGAFGLGVVNNKVYVIGGIDGSTPLATNEEYDPATNTWANKTPMTTARYGVTAAVVDNKIHLIGGSNTVPFTSALTTNEEFDPSTNTWATRASMAFARAGHTTSVVNNKIYAIGGGNGVSNLSSNEEYDPVTNTWVTRTSMTTARIGLASAVVNDRIYAIGGAGTTGYLTTNEEYNPATNSWATKAGMPTPRSDFTAVAVNNRVYALGGQNLVSLLATNEEYNPATNMWASKGSMPTARRCPGGVEINQKIYIIGGLLSITLPLIGVSTNEEFSPAPELLYIHRKN